MNTESQQQIARETAEKCAKISNDTMCYQCFTTRPNTADDFLPGILSVIERATEQLQKENTALLLEHLSALAAIEKIKEHAANTDQILIFNMCHSVDLSLLHEHDAEHASHWWRH